MLDLTREEVKIVLAVTVNRYLKLKAGDVNGKSELRSAIEKLAREYGYADGQITALMVKSKMLEGIIKQ